LIVALRRILTVNRHPACGLLERPLLGVLTAPMLKSASSILSKKGITACLYGIETLTGD
jgi:hypothetical protein